MTFDAFLAALPLALFIFGMRVCDVSIGTIRSIYTIRGKKYLAASLGLIESIIWITAISRLFKYVDSPINIGAWGLGFACGTLVGITIEQFIASGQVLIRAISKNHAIRLRAKLLDEGYGVTAIQGQGRDGDVLVLFVVAPRKHARDVLKIIDSIDPDAFITVEPVGQAFGGWFPSAAEPAAIRK